MMFERKDISHLEIETAKKPLKDRISSFFFVFVAQHKGSPPEMVARHFGKKTISGIKKSAYMAWE